MGRRLRASSLLGLARVAINVASSLRQTVRGGLWALLPFVQVETTSDWDGMRLLGQLGDAMMQMMNMHAMPGFGGGGVYVMCRSGASEGNNARGVQCAMHMLMLVLGLFRRRWSTNAVHAASVPRDSAIAEPNDGIGAYMYREVISNRAHF